ALAPCLVLIYAYALAIRVLRCRRLDSCSVHPEEPADAFGNLLAEPCGVLCGQQGISNDLPTGLEELFQFAQSGFLNRRKGRQDKHFEFLVTDDDLAIPNLSLSQHTFIHIVVVKMKAKERI